MRVVVNLLNECMSLFLFIHSFVSTEIDPHTLTLTHWLQHKALPRSLILRVSHSAALQSPCQPSLSCTLPLKIAFGSFFVVGCTITHTHTHNLHTWYDQGHRGQTRSKMSASFTLFLQSPLEKGEVISRCNY